MPPAEPGQHDAGETPADRMAAGIAIEVLKRAGREANGQVGNTLHEGLSGRRGKWGPPPHAQEKGQLRTQAVTSLGQESEAIADCMVNGKGVPINCLPTV